MKVGATISGIGAGIGGVGGAVLAPLIGLAKHAIDAGSAITDLSARIGGTTEELSAMAYGLELGGGSIEDLETGIKKMQQHLAKSGGGGGSLTDQIGAFADEIAAMEDPAMQTARAIEIFGKGGLKLMPFLKQGSAGMKELMAQAARDGAIWSKEDADKADRIGDSLSRVWTIVKSLGKAIGMAFLPAADSVEGFANAISGIGATIRKFIEENSGIIKIIGIVGGALVGIGSILGVVGVAFLGVSAAISAAVTVFGALSAVFTAVVSPIGLIIAGIAAVTASVGYLLYNFTSLGEIFETTWGGIAAAIAKGDLKAAMNIAWLGIKLVWQTGISWLENLWIGFKYSMFRTWEEIASSLKISIFEALAEVQKELKGTWAGRRIEGNLGNFEGLAEAAKTASKAAMDDLNVDEVWERAAANAGSDQARAELEAAVAAAKKQEEKVKKSVEGVKRAAAGSFLSNTVAGGFGSGLSSSLSIGSNRNIADNTKATADNTGKIAKSLEGAGPLVWAA